MEAILNQEESLVEASTANQNSVPRAIRPGFFGISWLLPAAKKTLANSDGRVIYLTQHTKAVLWESVAPGMRYGADRRDSRLLAVLEPSFRGGVPTLDPVGAEMADVHPDAKAELSIRLQRVVTATEECVYSASNRHNPAQRKRFKEPQPVRFGGEDHARLPDAREWAPIPLIGMKKVSAEVLWRYLHQDTGHPGQDWNPLHEDFRWHVARTLKNPAVYAPCDGAYLGIRGGDTLANRHVFRPVEGADISVMLLRDAVVHRQPGERVRLGDEIGFMLDMPMLKRIEGAHANLDLYDEVRRKLGWQRMHSVELGIINQSIDWLAPDRPTVPWNIFHAAITADPARFYWYATDFTAAAQAYDDGSNAVCQAFSRPRDRAEVDIMGMRVIFPSTRDVLVRREPRWARSGSKPEAKQEPKADKPVKVEKAPKIEKIEQVVEEAKPARTDKKAFRKAKAEAKQHTRASVNTKAKVAHEAQAKVEPKPEFVPVFEDGHHEQFLRIMGVGEACEPQPQEIPEVQPEPQPEPQPEVQPEPLEQAVEIIEKMEPAVVFEEIRPKSPAELLAERLAAMRK